MNFPFKSLLGVLLAGLTAIVAVAQQQPVVSVKIDYLNVGGDVTLDPLTNKPAVPLAFTGGTTFGDDEPVNEAYGPAGTTILIAARAVGTFPAAGYIYTFFVDGQTVGTLTPNPANGTYGVGAWTPPHPGSYFISVKAEDGISPAVFSLPIRYFATGTEIVSPVNGSLVPNGSSVVIQAVAMGPPLANPGQTDAFVSRVDFYADGLLIGNDFTYPYSIIYTPQTGGSHTIEARSFDNDGNQIGTPSVEQLRTVTAIGSPPTCVINSPTDGVGISIPDYAADALAKITIAVDAHSSSGLINKVELYTDGILFDTKTQYPYSFEWRPRVTGTYRLVALAYDDKNNVVASTVSNAAATATLTGGTVTGVNVTNAGSGYTSAPPVSFVGGGGSGAAASSLMQLAAIAITNPGGGYQSIPTVTLSGGGGTGATAKASVMGGFVTGVTVTGPGTGYTSAPTVSFSGGGGTGATATASLRMASISVSAGGSGYTSAPTVAIVPSLSPATPVPTTVIIAEPPTVTIVSPSNGATVTGGSPTAMIANVTSSNGSAIVSVQFFDNGAYVGTAPTPSSGSAYTFTYAPSRKFDSDGNPIPTVITALASDAFGISKLSAGIGLNVTAGGSTVPPVIGIPPTVALSAPLAGAQLAVNGAVPLSANATDEDGNVVSVQFFVNGQASEDISYGASASKSPSTDTSYPYAAVWTPHSLGIYNLSAKVTDNDGNVITGEKVQVTVVDVSSAAPSVALTSPGTGSVLTAGTTVGITAAASDDVAVASVQFYINGQAFGVADTTFPFSIAWTPASPGNYTLSAVATDNTGRSTTAGSVTVRVVPNASPLVTLTAPVPGTAVTAGTPTQLAAIASDSDGKVVSVDFFANGVLIDTVAASPYVLTWTPTVAGLYSLVARAVDNSGNATSSSAVTLTVAGNLPPSVKITSPANGSSVRIGATSTVTATATDLDGAIVGVQFFANGVSVGTATTPPYKAQWVPLGEGVYRLTATAVDNAGAVATSASVLVVGSASAGDAIATGTYQGVGEAGNFAVVAATGKLATFIAYSTLSASARTYYYPNIPVNAAGGYSLTDSAGKSLVAGTVSETGSNGTFDGGRLTFIGVDTRFFPVASPVASGYFKGTFTGRTSSTIAAIAGLDGSLMLYAADGALNDAASGKVDASGAFDLASARGNRFTGKADPVSGLLTGTLSGTGGGAFTAAPATLGTAAADKVLGLATEVGSNITLASNGRTYDQVLLKGTTASVTADPGQVTRISFTDLSEDIVQVEFSGAGRLSVTLDNATGPAPATNYNQPDVSYMRGHAGIVITGADETTNVAVFSVGRITAANPALFKDNVTYDGVADIAYITILSTSGRFGGVRTANVNYVASQGFAGICAPGVQFSGPVYVGDITASNTATPMLLLGSSTEVQINGGNLWQANARPVQVSGVTRLKFVNGTTSGGTLLPAQADRSRLEQDGQDVTGQLVVNPGP